jgi:hypothetical protein
VADESEGASRRGRAGGIDANRDSIVIRFPKLDADTWGGFLDLLPGRSLMRVLGDPPEEFFSHARAARRERLMAVRSLLDALIEDTDRPEDRHRPAREVQID